MRQIKSLAFMMLLLMAATSATMAQNWQTAYETDFSDDPVWTTNNSSRFYWDAVSESYVTDNYTNSQEWAKTDVTYNGESFRLTFDVLPVREPWETGDVNVGLFGPTMVSNSSDTEERVYVMIGGYEHQIYITGYDSGGECIYSGAGSSLMQESALHHVVIQYDAASKELSLDVTVNSAPVLAWQIVLSHGFSSNLQHLGASMVGSWVESNRHEVAYIDNICLELDSGCGSECDSLLLPSVAVRPCDDECAVQPVQVANGQPIEGVSGAITSPDGVKFCGATVAGLVTDTWGLYTMLSEDSTTIAFSMFPEEGDDYLPVGTTTVVNLLYEADRQCSDDHYVHWDTTLSGDLSWYMMFSDTLGGNVVPGFDASRDSATVEDFLVGDFTDDGTIDIADLIGVVTYMFQDGTPPCLMAIMDVNGSGAGPDIADLIYLVNYMFQEGPEPPCPGEGSAGKVVSDPAVGLSRVFAEGVTTFSLNSPYDLLGVQLELAGTGTGEPISMLGEGIELISGREGDRIKLGILDMEGVHAIDAGENLLFMIDGEWEIISALAADQSFNTIIPTLNAKTEAILPTSFALDQNYPNPFNPITEISFSLPVASDVTISVYNMLGQTVAVVADEHMTAGHHTVTWDGSNVASGVYFYRLSTSEFTDTKKMMLLK